jgi:hypothetical protein
MPIATKLVAALCVPYVLAKGVFPRFGYSAAVNSTVYRFAWLVILGLGVLRRTSHSLALIFIPYIVGDYSLI